MGVGEVYLRIIYQVVVRNAQVGTEGMHPDEMIPPVLNLDLINGDYFALSFSSISPYVIRMFLCDKA